MYVELYVRHGDEWKGLTYAMDEWKALAQKISVRPARPSSFSYFIRARAPMLVA
jgi:hypothetical protein